MARQDYARRKPKKQQRKPAVSRWVMIFTLGVSIAFLVGLWLLSQQPDDTNASAIVTEKTKPTETVKLVPKKTDKGQANKDTSATKGSFDFYTLLPDSKVTPEQVEAYVSTPKDPKKKTNVILQAGSFRKQADANRLRAQLILINMSGTGSASGHLVTGLPLIKLKIFLLSRALNLFVLIKPLTSPELKPFALEF